MTETSLFELVELSRSLARPEMDCVILGEGNTSALADATSFWIKGSGNYLSNIKPNGFVKVQMDAVLEMLQGEMLNDQEVKDALTRAKVNPEAGGHPSVETLLHAQLLSLNNINFIGHTHPTAINMISCSKAFPEAYSGRLFPDEIVLCGVAPLLIPYTDPGIPLARKVGVLLNEYLDHYGETPRVVIMQNHGFIALGQTAQEVLDITAMATKTARVLMGAYIFGGPNFLSQKDVDRIHTRPDEIYRQIKLGLKRD
jgi:rhamnose utilization protein RhaD (predicted bifunctional aldolase and dehydrogenase)